MRKNLLLLLHQLRSPIISVIRSQFSKKSNYYMPAACQKSFPFSHYYSDREKYRVYQTQLPANMGFSGRNLCSRSHDDDKANCWNCNAVSASMTPFLVCQSCQAIQPVDHSIDYFQIFSLEKKFHIDDENLEGKYKAWQKKLHPDLVHSKSKEEREYAAEQSARVIDAYRTLGDSLARAIYIMKLAGVEVDEEQTVSESELLSEIVEIREAVEEAVDTQALNEIQAQTTLLNHILTADHGKRIAVIENEYGEVDIDGSLVAAKTAGAEDIVMLNNGCLCCTVRGDLVRMIAELVATKKGRFDHIVIETTGLANPAPIIQTFYAEDQIFNDVKLDGVVTLVDAKHATIHLDEIKPEGVVNEAIEEIAYADRIIVNKTDLVGESDIASLTQRIRNINRMANLKRTEFGKVDLDYVLGIGGFDLERIESAVDAEGSKEDHVGHKHDHDHHEHDHNCGHEHHDDHHSHDHTHDPGVSSISIVCEGSLDLEKANMWLGTLLMEQSEDIYRMKGLLSVDGMDERFVFQGVHDIFQGSPDRPWEKNEARVNKIVFIGKNLNKQEIEKGFKACLL